MEPRRGGADHLVEGVADGVGGAGELGGAEALRLHDERGDLVGGRAAEHGRGALAGRRDDDEVAQALEQVLDEPARVLPGLHDAVDGREGAGRVALGDRGDDLVDQRACSCSRAARSRARTRRWLPSDPAISWSSSERVSRDDPPPALTTSGSTPGSTETPSLSQRLADVVEHLRGRDEPERVVVGAGPDGADDLLGLGGREDELHVLRRLLDDLQQRVEALRRDHVRLVEDEDLVAVAGGGEDGALAEVAGVVDAVVARRVDLDHVERAARRRGRARRSWRRRRTGCRSGPRRS